MSTIMKNLFLLHNKGSHSFGPKFCKRLLFAMLGFLPLLSFAQAPWYDPCTNPNWITPGVSCTNTAGTMWNATQTPGVGAFCGAPTNAADVWFSFTAKSVNPTITLSSMGAQLDNNPRLQIFSGACGGLTSLSCVSGTNTTTLSLNATGLTVGTNYLVRVFTTSTTATAGVTADWNFNICIVDQPPANDNCAGAILLTPGTSCVNTTGNVYASTVSTPGIAPCTGTLTYDVWYRFVATSAYNTVRLSSISGSFQNPRLQLFSGTCGGLTHVDCGTTTSPYTLTPGGAGLIVGNTYYVRVYSGGGSIPNSSSTFNICVTTPVPADIECTKSYINVTKGQGGGTVAPGDTLEIRATIVVQSQAIDSVMYRDTLFNNRGLRLVPGSIALRTNEGKIYTQFTDAQDTDAGWFNSFGAGPDTAIRMNIGLGASNSARGKLRSTSKPSFYDFVCIMMATYRVVVYASYDTKINFGGGAFSFRDSATATDMARSFRRDSIMVYQSPGLCPNAVAAVNAIGVESNGTFGTPAGNPPLARNRGTSAYVPNYIYRVFSSSSGPDDYYYGVVNNTSARYTTVTTWPKPDGNSPNYRQFSNWDIIGDHTGATNQAKGNPPCDTTQPVSAANPCGYMLVINSAYRTDTAFQYSVSNLCPNTYYELSAWVRNMCYKCGCDSNGNAASNGAYIPSATNDSSGVQPNLAFEINGTDYFTTGNLRYTGTTAAGSDTTNQWVKKGFIYRTGPSESSFVLGIRNNAPGGGGNDWVIDDISLATCLPRMNFYPALTPSLCAGTSITLIDTVRSFYNSYTHYKWQRSTNGGATWNDLPGTTGVATPTWNGSAYQYLTGYVVTPAFTSMSNNGDRYRVIVATTAANLSDSRCQVTDGTSIITLNIINCGVVLKTDLLSFNGKLVNSRTNLSWTTSREYEPVRFDIERSHDGRNFSRIATVEGYHRNVESNQYSFVDPVVVNKNAFYRLSIFSPGDRAKISRIIHVYSGRSEFDVNNVVNPFADELLFEVSLPLNEMIDVELVDLFGKTVRKRTYGGYSGSNSLSIKNTAALPAGMYILSVKTKDKSIIRKVVKR